MQKPSGAALVEARMGAQNQFTSNYNLQLDYHQGSFMEFLEL